MAGAVVASAAIVAAAWWWGGGLLGEGGGRTAPADISDFTGVNPSRVGGGPRSSVEAIERGTLLFVADAERSRPRTRITYDQLEFLPRNVLEVTRPRATIEVGGDALGGEGGGGRRVLITADAATLVAPGDELRDGTFRGHVVMSQFDGGREIARVQLDTAEFDMVLGRITSSTAVHLSTDAIDFRGTGLSLTYNQTQNRLEHLEVARGREVRFNPSPRRDGTDQPPVPPVETLAAEDAAEAATLGTEHRSTPATNAEDSPERDRSSQDADDAAVPAAGHQYYRARFLREVVIADERGEAKATADAMSVLFATAADPEGGPSLTRASHRRFYERLAATGSVGGGPATAGGAGASAPRLVAELVGSGWGVAQVEAGSADGPAGDRVSLMPLGADDVTIRWTGPLIVEPMEEKPASLEGPGDVELGLTGDPVVVRTRGGLTVRGASLGYLASTGRVTAGGSDATPLWIASAGTGSITGRSLMIDQRAGTGYVLGPGRLTTDSTDASSRISAPGQTPASQPSAPPADPAAVSWDSRLDLQFFVQNTAYRKEATRHEPPASADRLLPQTGIMGLRSATFRGEVRGEHPRFSLGGDEVAIDFTLDHAAANATANIESGERDARSIPRRVTAKGDAAVVGRGDTIEDRLTVNADTLVIDLAPLAPLDAPPAAGAENADGQWAARVTPRGLLATGGVHVVREDLDLTADLLQAELSQPPRPPDTEPATPPIQAAAANAPSPATQRGLLPVLVPSKPRPATRPTTPPATQPATPAAARTRTLQLTGLTATGSVRVRLRDLTADAVGGTDGAVLVAARLWADPQTEQIELFDDAGLASVSTGTASLLGSHLILTRRGQVIRVDGPGQLRADDAGEADQAAAAAAADSLLLTWTSAMTFEGDAGIAHVVGDAVAVTHSPDTSTRLTAGDLRVRFDPIDSDTPTTQTTTQPTTQPAATQPDDRGRGLALRVRTVTARENVVFTAEQRATPTDPPLPLRPDAAADGGPDAAAVAGKVLSRLRLEGPLVTLDQSRGDEPIQQLQVLGRGLLLLEDYRPAKPPKSGDAEPAGSIAGSQLDGRGATLFIWSERLIVDAIANDVTMLGDVEMIHKPLTPEARVLKLWADRLAADVQETGGLIAADPPAGEVGGEVGDDSPRASPRVRSLRADGGVRVRQGENQVDAAHLLFEAEREELLLWADRGGEVRVQSADQSTAPTSVAARAVWWYPATGRFRAADVSGTTIPIE